MPRRVRVFDPEAPPPSPEEEQESRLEFDDSLGGDTPNPSSKLWKEANRLIAPFFTESGVTDARDVLSESLADKRSYVGREDLGEAEKELLSRISDVSGKTRRSVEDPKEPTEAKSQKAQRDRYEQEERLEKKFLKRVLLVLRESDPIDEPLTWKALSERLALEEMIGKRDPSLTLSERHLQGMKKLYGVYTEAHSLGIKLPASETAIQERLDWLNMK